MYLDHVYLAVCLYSMTTRLLECFFQNTPVGRSVFMVNATDPDQGTGGSVLFSFQPSSPFFAIDGARGTVTVIRALDYETTSAYQLTVNATVSTHITKYSVNVSADPTRSVKLLNTKQLFLFLSGSRQSEASVPACQLSYQHH